MLLANHLRGDIGFRVSGLKGSSFPHSLRGCRSGGFAKTHARVGIGIGV